MSDVNKKVLLSERQSNPLSTKTEAIDKDKLHFTEHRRPSLCSLRNHPLHQRIGKDVSPNFRNSMPHSPMENLSVALTVAGTENSKSMKPFPKLRKYSSSDALNLMDNMPNPATTKSVKPRRNDIPHLKITSMQHTTIDLPDRTRPIWPGGNCYMFRSKSHVVQPTHVNNTAEDKSIITPFAQILSSLGRAKSQIVEASEGLQNNSKEDRSPSNDKDDNINGLLLRAVNEIEWSLSKLLKMASRQSIGSLATMKFKRLLNRELSLCNDGSRTECHISNYIYQTFIEHDQVDSSGNESNEDNFDELEEPLPNHLTSSPVLHEDIRLGNQRATSMTFSVSKQNCIRTSQKLSSNSGADGKKSLLDVTTKRTSPSSTLCLDKQSKDNVGWARFKHSPAFVFANRALCQLELVCKRSVELSQQRLPNDHEDNPAFYLYFVNSQMRDPVQVYMERSCDRWGFDVFHLNEIANDFPLTSVAYHILNRRNILNTLKIPRRSLLNYLQCLEHMYHMDNPYHNRIHAADVTQSTHILLNTKALKEIFSDMDIFATIMGAAMHDVNHPGVTNQFIINTNGDLALIYNDVSVLENHHTSCAFTLLMRPENMAIFSNLTQKDYSCFRRVATEVIFATDMSKHMKLMADFRTMIEANRVSRGNQLVLERYSDRIQILQTLVHCADLSNPTKPFLLYKTWAERILEEFHRQGDLERSCGMEISPMCDRETASLAKSQVSFMDFVVYPLWETWCDLVYPDGQEMLDNLRENYRIFKESVQPSARGSREQQLNSQQITSITTVAITQGDQVSVPNYPNSPSDIPIPSPDIETQNSPNLLSLTEENVSINHRDNVNTG